MLVTARRLLTVALPASLLVAAPAFAQPAGKPPAPTGPASGAPASGAPAMTPPVQPVPETPTPVDPTADAEVIVLTVQTLDVFEQAEALSVALRRAVDRSQGYKLPKTEKDLALQVLVLSLDCKDPPDAACEQKIGDEIKSDSFVWGIMKKDGADVTGTLNFWARGLGSKSTPFRYSANLTDGADEALISLAAKHLDEITGGPPPAVITIKAGTLNGEILLGGKVVAKLENGVANVRLEPGIHELEVVADNHETMLTKVDVKARERRTITLTPVVKEDNSPDVQKILGFTSLGLGAAAAGVATYAGFEVLRINTDLDQYRATNIASGQDGCDAGTDDSYPYVSRGDSNDVIDLCKEGEPMEMLTLVMWPVAGTLAGLGVILIATADWSGGANAETTLPFEVLPSFDNTHATLTVRGRF